jgi:hypothetical protein
MYDSLNTTELTVLQDMLYTATEKAYQLAHAASADQARLGHHAEIARLFLEAGQELLDRLDQAA